MTIQEFKDKVSRHMVDLGVALMDFAEILMTLGIGLWSLTLWMYGKTRHFVQHQTGFALTIILALRISSVIAQKAEYKQTEIRQSRMIDSLLMENDSLATFLSYDCGYAAGVAKMTADE